MIESTLNEVEDFIRKFKIYDQNGVLESTFLNGFCYWFAYILAGRFVGAEIYYEPIDGHFITEIDDRLYDIRGDVTDLYPPPRNFYSEEYCLECPSIVDGCILKIS